MPRTRPALPFAVPLACLGLIAGLAGCGSIPVIDRPAAPPAAEQTASPTPSAAPSRGSDDEADSGSGDFADVFAEREQFMKDQQLPLDGSLLTATTPEQKDFISQQRAYVESKGGQWSAEEESISLALASDACETAILNRHEVDATTMRTHVATSPLFATLIPKDADEAARSAAEKNIASVMVFGTTFLCPADGASWKAAYHEVYGG